jgi:hypothetical protein
VKPSLLRNSSATNCGAIQTPVQSYSLIRVVSGGPLRRARSDHQKALRW